MAIRAVVFDLGDTLVTQEPLVGSVSNRLGAAAVAAIMRAFAETPPTAGQLAESLGEALHDAVAEAYRTECALPDVRQIFREVFDRFDWEPTAELLDLMLPAYFKPWFDAMTADEQAAPVLSLLRTAGLSTGLIANLIYGDELLRARLSKLRILNQLDTLVLSTETGWFKPHPAAFREAQQRLGITADEGLMVGDDWEFDVQAPQRMGMRAIWLRRDGAEAPDGVTPDETIERLGDLLPAIARQESPDPIT